MLNIGKSDLCVKKKGAQILLCFFYINFQTHDRKEPQHLADGPVLPKLSIACRTQHRQFSPIYCMNDLNNDIFWPFKNATKLADLRTFQNDAFPTSLHREQCSRMEDHGMKVCFWI